MRFLNDGFENEEILIKRRISRISLSGGLS